MTETEAKILNQFHRQRFIDDLRYNRTRQGAFENSCLHLDHPLTRGGNLLQPSDHGDGAQKIRKNLEETPLWLKLWRIKRRQLSPSQRKILDALMVDWRTTYAAKLASCSPRSVDYAKTFFKVHFAQCYQAWKAHFRG